jgi:hypothetical protein
MRRALIVVFIAAAFCGHAGSATRAELDRLSAEMDRLAGAAIRAQDTGTCNIHHIRMQKKAVPIYFGGPFDFDSPFYYATMRSFPNARDYVNGGCEYDAQLEKKPHSRYVCPECQRSQLVWARAHPRDSDAQWILKRPKT